MPERLLVSARSSGMEISRTSIRSSSRFSLVADDAVSRNIMHAFAPPILASVALLVLNITPAFADDLGTYAGKWETDSSQSRVVGEGGQTWMCDRPHEGPLTYVV